MIEEKQPDSHHKVDVLDQAHSVLAALDNSKLSGFH